MIVAVAATSPLTVREIGSSNPVPAKVVTGSSYAPVVGDMVVALFERGRFYILGGCK